MGFYKYIQIGVLCAGISYIPLGQALAISGDEQLLVTHGEIIRDRGRITFEWAKPVDFSIEKNGKTVSVHFSRQTNLDAGEILSRLSPYVTNVERKGDGRTITITLDRVYQIRKFIHKNIGGIEIVGLQPKAVKPQNLAQNTNGNLVNKLAKLSPAAGEETVQAPKAVEDDSNPQEKSDENTAPVQLNKILISTANDSATLRFPLAQRTAFAVFIRNHYLWIVLEKPVKLDTSEFDDMQKTVIGKPQIIANAKATILHMPIDSNVYASIRKEDNSNNIALLLTQKKQPTALPLPVEISTAPPAPPHIMLPTLEMEESIAARDPIIGDMLLITPLFKMGEGIATTREFVDFDLLETAQGIVAVKKTDDVSMVQLRNGLRITTKKGATISPNIPKLDIKAVSESAQSNPTLFPYEIWKADIKTLRKEQLRKLFQETISENIQDANNARLKMAQIYLSEGLAPEAIGVLDGINRSNPAFFRIAKLSAMRGAANFLMARYIDSARDFAAVELNNNKEIEYWRSVLADLLGDSSQTYDYLSMNDDYISKYPPVFRQNLAIVAADRAISSKDYNIALKIFDSLHQDNLLDSINAYINFLMAKISMSTGQEKEASEKLDKLADDIKHPFVRARAEFTRIAREMEADADKEKIIDRLERLRLNWHGDNLELQILSILGELYHEKKDYVNAMRVWHNGIQVFKNTATAIDMTRKMEEAFIIMFNEGIADQLPPLEALALYYEYRSYMPKGTAGNEMLDRLSDRLVSVDLLEQAANLLDYQMHSQAEKERRSQIGAKLATVHLLNHKPQKALSALQDSVYGENPVMLRLLRNRLAAEAMSQLEKPDLALQTLGQDDSLDSERIRINIYWQAKDWQKLTTTVENILKNRQDITAPMTMDESEYLLKLALAYVFTNNKEQLQYLRDYFTPLMVKNPNYEIFDFITTQDIVPNSRNFDEVIQSVNNTSSFVNRYKAKIKLPDSKITSSK